MPMDSDEQAGWVVEVVIPAPEGAAPTFRYFNVAIPNANKAVAATRKTVSVAEGAGVEVVRPLSVGEIAVLAIESGALKEA
jgi:hypothetical protein